MGLYVSFHWPLESEEPLDDPIVDGPFDALRFEGGRLLDARTGGVVAELVDVLWRRPQDGRLWCKFSIVAAGPPQDGSFRGQLRLAFRRSNGEQEIVAGLDGIGVLSWELREWPDGAVLASNEKDQWVLRPDIFGLGPRWDTIEVSAASSDDRTDALKTSKGA